MSYAEMKERFAASKFRSRFKLTHADRAYLAAKSWDVIRAQTARIIGERLAPAFPDNDAKYYLDEQDTLHIPKFTVEALLSWQ